MTLGPWTEFGLKRVGSARLEARGRDVVRLLSDRGVTLPSDGRLPRAIDRIASVNKEPHSLHTMGDDEAALLLEANRDIFDAFVATWTLIERPRTPPALPLPKFACFGEGTDHPAADSNPLARNTQFELLAGSYFVLGGGHVLPDEPDFSLLYGGRRVGIAVKRLSSVNPNTLNTRLREAADQLAAAQGVGFVCVNLDSWLSDLTGNSAEEVGARFTEALKDAYRPIGRNASRRPAILGILIFGTWLAWARAEGKRQLVWKSPFQFIGLGDSPEEERQFLEYMSGLRHSWEGSFTDLGALLSPAA
jgi:hypothetical protein